MDRTHLIKIGLTGGIGSGKSTVAKLFQELGVPVIDSDHIVHQLSTPSHPVFKEIVQHFGKEILEADGSLNRKKLGTLIFNAPDERLWLGSLLHPLVKKEILHQCALLPQKAYVIIEIPLLIEADFQDAVDYILLVDSKEDLQIERVQQRQALAEKEIRNILNTQASRETRLQHADQCIHNTGTLLQLQKEVEALHQYYIKLSK